MTNVKILKLSPTAQIPQKAHKNDACFDVFCDRIERVSDDFFIAYLGFALEIPVGWKGVLVPRSSFTKYKWLVQNSPGQIDCDYRGELQFRFRAIPEKVDVVDVKLPLKYGRDREISQIRLKYPEFPFNVGDRIGQLYFEPVHQVDFTQIEKLTPTVRSENGFGSTGC